MFVINVVFIEFRYEFRSFILQSIISHRIIRKAFDYNYIVCEKQSEFDETIEAKKIYHLLKYRD